MKMGTAQKQNIATQHRIWNRMGVQKTNPVEFDKWFLTCLRKCEKKGAVFDLSTPCMVKITWPGKTAILRKIKDFEDEYQEEHLPKFYF